MPKKQTYIYMAVGFSLCLSIVAFSLSLFFGLREDDVCVAISTTTTTTTTSTTAMPFPPKNNGSQHTPLDDFVFSNESLHQFSWKRAENFDFSGKSQVTNTSYNAYVVNMTSGEWLNGKRCTLV